MVIWTRDARGDGGPDELGGGECAASTMPALVNKPLEAADQAVESELAMLVSEYLQFHHCTGAYEVSHTPGTRDRRGVVGGERFGSKGACVCGGNNIAAPGVDCGRFALA